MDTERLNTLANRIETLPYQRTFTIDPIGTFIRCMMGTPSGGVTVEQAHALLSRDGAFFNMSASAVATTSGQTRPIEGLPADSLLAGARLPVADGVAAGLPAWACHLFWADLPTVPMPALDPWERYMLRCSSDPMYLRLSAYCMAKHLLALTEEEATALFDPWPHCRARVRNITPVRAAAALRRLAAGEPYTCEQLYPVPGPVPRPM